jgi:glycosyltransferase involved in cell wall biosynthesis
MINVFVIGPRGFPGVQGGIEKYSEELYKRLSKHADIKITALVISKYYKERVKEWEGVKFIYIRALNSKNLEKISYGLIATLITILKKPDIVHFHGLSCGLYIPLLKVFGLRVILTFQSRDYLYPKWDKFAKYIWKLSEKAALKSDHIIAVSNAHMKYLEQYTNHVIEIPNGANINHLDISDDEEEYYLYKYGLKKKGYILFVGRFTPEKSIEDLIEAYIRLNSREFKLVIAGDADHEDDYSRMIKNLVKKSSNIILTGFIKGKELQTIFQNAKLFVLPSKFEGLPHVLLEAICYKVEILASNIEANIQINLNKENYFKQGDIEDLKNKLNYILKKDISEKEIERRLEMIRDFYNWDKIAEKIYELYKKEISLKYY